MYKAAIFKIKLGAIKIHKMQGRLGEAAEIQSSIISEVNY